MSAGERLAVALVRGLHGLRGAVRAEVLTDRPEERFRPGAVLFAEGSNQPLTIVTAQPSEPGWLIRFDEVADRTAAEGLRDTYLEVELAPADTLPRGEYYWHEVIGARVSDVDGRDLGTVVDVYRAGAAEVFVVQGEPYGEFDVPAVRDFVRIMAPRRGEIVVDADALELVPPETRRPRGRRSTRGASDARDAGTDAGAGPDGGAAVEPGSPEGT